MTHSLCVAVCCSVSQCVAVCCSVFATTEAIGFTSYLWHDSFICVTWRIHMCDMTHPNMWHDTKGHVYHSWRVRCSMLQCVAACCSVLQRVAACCSVLQHVAVCCSVLQCVAVCCSVFQCVTVCCSVLLNDTCTTHGGDQTWNIWISRSIGFPHRSFEWRGLRLLNVYATEKSFGMLGTPVKTCLMCMGTPMKTCWILWQS